MKKPVRIVLIVLAVLLCTGAVVLNVPWRSSARFDALEIDLDDPDYLRHAEIAADGTVSLNLFAQSYFTGAVTVEGYPETFDAAAGTAVGLPPEFAPLTYKLRRVQNESGTWEYAPYTLGTLYWQNGPERAVILVHGEEGGRRLCLAVGAQTRGEALDALRAALANCNAGDISYAA